MARFRQAGTLAATFALALPLATGAASDGDGASVAPDEPGVEQAPPPDPDDETQAPTPDPDAALRARALGAGLDGAVSYLRANVRDERGQWGYVHLTPDDMPLVVAVGMPKDPPRYGSRKQAREAVLDGIRIWVRALRPHVPWFAVRFVESDPDAAVQVEWKRRIVGPYAGFGGIGYALVGGRVIASGRMEISTRPGEASSLGLSVDQVRELVAHEFGHVLGLAHCLHCDSIMNYENREGVSSLVTATDVKTYLHLLAQPNGSRHGGGLLAGVTRPGWALDPSQP
jgi:hypothetical protein